MVEDGEPGVLQSRGPEESDMREPLTDDNS